MPEFFDVVDADDRVLRRETREEVHRQRLLHRAVHVLVFNGKGEAYLQRRSPKKDTYPNRWTTSCSGHVDAGEDYETAVVRELAEELGLKGFEIRVSDFGSTMQSRLAMAGTSERHARKSKLETGALQPFLKHPPCRETGWEFIWIYTLTTDATPAPDPGEISEGRWIAPSELDAWMAREPRAFTPSFMLVWQLWRGKQDQ